VSRKGGSKGIAEKRRELLRELFGVELVPVPTTGAVVPELVELPAGLAELLGKTELPKVRKVPGEQKYALADVGAALLGKDSNHGAEDLQHCLWIWPDLDRRLGSSLLANPGQRSHEVKVGDLAAVVEYIMLLPGTTAAKIRAQAAKLLVRYLGGDLGLLDEVREMRHVQDHLAEVDPTNWTRAFGEAVEAQPAVVLPPEALTITAAVEDCQVKCEKHLYLLYVPSLNVSRPGRTESYERRLVEHQRTLAPDAHYTLKALNYGHLEKAVHRLFRQQRVSPRDEKIPGQIDAGELAALLPELHRQFLAEAAAQPEEEERALKRRRLTVEVRHLELEADERQSAVEKDRALAEVHVDEARALAQLRVEKARWAFEREKAEAGTAGGQHAAKNRQAWDQLVRACTAFHSNTGSWPKVWKDINFKRDSAVVRATTRAGLGVAEAVKAAQDGL